MNPMRSRSLSRIVFITLFIFTFLLGLISGFYWAHSGLLYPGDAPEVSYTRQAQDAGGAIEEDKKATNNYQEGYKDALAYAQERIAQKYWTDYPLTRVSGVIQSIEGNVITLKHPASDFNILEKGFITTIFTISDSTFIEKHIPKTEAEIMAGPTEADLGENEEIAFFNYKVETLALNDLQVGDSIELYTSNDIRSADPIKLFKVIIQES